MHSFSRNRRRSASWSILPAAWRKNSRFVGRRLPPITAFVNHLDPRDEVFLLAFSDRPYLLAPLGTDHTELIHNLSILHAYGRTAIYDTITDGLTMLSHGCYPTKALLVITDGMDTASRANLDETATAASKAKVPIYSIGYRQPQSSDRFIPHFYDHGQGSGRYQSALQVGQRHRRRNLSRHPR
ncbi:MAG: vWA domain-containing protein [Candidatus Binataceae bacterium]